MSAAPAIAMGPPERPDPSDHLDLVHFVVARVARGLPNHIDRDDLVGEGVLGLMDAAEKWDAGANTKFRTYAEFRIRGAVLDHLRGMSWTSRGVRSNQRRAERARRDLAQHLGREPGDDELADHMGV